VKRTRFIAHRGRRILLMDFSNVLDPSDGLRYIEEAKGVVARQPMRSVRTLVQVEGSHFDAQITGALKELALHNKPYVIASAVVGLSGLHRVILNAVTTFSERYIVTFSNADAAKDWLIQQP
jgi:hypothetical protein